MNHELKCWPDFYERLADGTKTFECRRNDRGFQKGDYLKICWFDPAKAAHGLPARSKTKPDLLFRVTYVLTGEQFGIKDGFCVIGIVKTEAEQ